MSKVINWTQYFMGVAKLSAFRSKDPNTQVGACIVNEANKIVGVGYNGLPWGCEDNEFPWEVREGDLYETKYPFSRTIAVSPFIFIIFINNFTNTTLNNRLYTLVTRK